MKLNKQSIVIVFLFCILLVLAAAPVSMLKYSNTQLTNTSNINPQTSPIIIDEPQIYDAPHYTSGIKAGEVLVESSALSLTDEQTATLLSSVREQLEILCNYNALPPIDFPKQCSTTVSKNSYIDMQKPHLSSNVWQIYIQSTYLDMVVYMDTNTATLRDISILSENELFSENNIQLSLDGFKAYLQDYDKLSENGIAFDVYGNFTSNSIRLFITHDPEAEPYYSYFVTDANESYDSPL